MLEKKYTEKTFTLKILYHVGVYENSIHFIFDHASKTCVIIDPAWEADLFIQRIKDKGYKLTDIWLTHWHGDHINAVDEIVEKTGARITIGINEVPYLQIKNKVQTVSDGDTIRLGKTNAKIINTPGHTAGGVCYLLDGHLIAGDTLFVYGAGHCSLPGANAIELYHSMQKLKQVDNDTMLHCGHDYGSKIETTMDEQKQGNAWLVIDTQADFVKFVDDMAQGLIAYPTDALNKLEIQAML
ncbi:Metallo-beta-lactamase family protein [uncultured Gammaproteobacteria bacterium]|jgi:glyoxylase-like metal-dependent hydrolase (beta-lactamase superfamily II)|nr:MBL-fold metallo-hydrolase superfamily [uncultured Gammaproteobacteria bacterium]VVH51797.1 Metallo-beta-lactamase family protein [uncultured Gammaproteobacteria bacterium]